MPNENESTQASIETVRNFQSECPLSVCCRTDYGETHAPLLVLDCPETNALSTACPSSEHTSPMRGSPKTEGNRVSRKLSVAGVPPTGAHKKLQMMSGRFLMLSHAAECVTKVMPKCGDLS